MGRDMDGILRKDYIWDNLFFFFFFLVLPSVVAKVLNYGFKVNEFELQSRYNVHFRNNTLGGKKVRALLSAAPHLPIYGLNSSANVLLQGWLRY